MHNDKGACITFLQNHGYVVLDAKSFRDFFGIERIHPQGLERAIIEIKEQYAGSLIAPDLKAMYLTRNGKSLRIAYNDIPDTVIIFDNSYVKCKT